MAKKEAGGKSSQQNDFLQPLAPTLSSATDVGTGRAYNDGAIEVTFSLDPLSPPATSYNVYDSGNNLLGSGSSSPFTVTGLSSDTSYTVYLTAVNNSGESDPSGTQTVTVTTVPATPSAPTASSTTADVDDVSWTAPSNGGSAITLYSWECDDGKSGTTASTSITVAQEGAGSSTNAYRVKATNANGDSEFSGYSSSVDTVAPFFPPFFPFFPPYFPPFFPFFPFFPYFPPFFPFFPFFPYFPPFFPFFPPYFPPFFPFFPFFPPFFPPYFPPYFPPRFGPYFPPFFPFFPPRFTKYFL
jgi:hypothetical protein